MSIQDIQQNPQDTSNFYLAGIYQTLTDPNRSTISSSVPASPPPFSPPSHAVWVNSLWFLSLAISITCALLATLLQQWARRYLRVTRKRHSLHERARIRSFFAEGVEKSFLHLAVEALPTLLHVSLFLFFAGLVVFLWNVNLTVFKAVLSWISFCTALYGCITLIPIFRRDSPYYTPLTSLAWLVVISILYSFHFLCNYIEVLALCCSSLFCSCGIGPIRMLGFLCRWLTDVLDAALRTPEEAALMSPPDIDIRALMWTFDGLDEDHELEGFFSGLPGFHNSKVLRRPLCSLNFDQRLKLLRSMIGLLNRTFSSDLLLNQVKHHRAEICAKVVELVDTPKAFPEILRSLVSEDGREPGCGPVQSTDMVDFVRRWDNHRSEDNTLVQAIFSVVVARVQQRNDSWFSLASKEMDVPEAVLRSHAAHGDSLSLAILIYLIRQQFFHFQNPSWPRTITNVLRAASRFNVQNTSLELQHEFCALWNQLVRKAQNDHDWTIAGSILSPIRRVYIGLHHGTNSVPTRFPPSTRGADYILMEESTYPVCCVAGHVQDDSALYTFARPILHDDNVTLLPAPLPDVPASSAPDLYHDDEGLSIVPTLDNSLPSQTIIEGLHIPVTSADPTTGCVIQNIDTSGVTITHHGPEISKVVPLSSSPSPATVAFQHNPDLLTPADPLNISSNPVLENTLPTGTLSTSPSPFTRSGLTLSFSGFPRSLIVTTTPGASLGITFAPDPCVPSKDDGSPKSGLRKEMDDLDLPSLNRAIYTNTTVTSDLRASLQSPLLPPITNSDIAIVGPSTRSPNAEPTENQPPDPSGFRYDIV